MDKTENKDDFNMVGDKLPEEEIKEHIEDVLREMCLGIDREWNENMVDKLYPYVYKKLYDDYLNADEWEEDHDGEEWTYIMPDEEMIITAMMELINEEN